MKNILILLCTITLFFSCKNETEPIQTQYQINVNAKGVYNGIRSYIVSQGMRNRQINIDTAMVINEEYSFVGNTNSPSIKYLTVDGVRGKLPIILEPGVLNIELDKDNIENSILTESPNNTALKTYNEDYKKFIRQINQNRRQLSLAMRNDDSNKDSLRSILNAKTQEIKNYPFDYINKNPDLDFSLILLESLLQSKPDLKKLKESFNNLEDIIDKNRINKATGSLVEMYIRNEESKQDLSIGKLAPDFTGPSTDGTILRLNDIKGKVTLIDFWASWCKPCRVENPNVVKIYEKYHDKGLEIISVSLDKPGKKSSWTKAIKDDNLQWYHVSNLQFWDDPIAKLYKVRSIPAAFLLDENGKIVAKKLKGKALEDKIASLLK